jgi:hypothetical protein
LKWAMVITVHHHCDGNLLQTNGPPGEYQDKVTEFMGLFSKPTDSNWWKGRQADFQNFSDPNGNMPFRTADAYSPRD